MLLFEEWRDTASLYGWAGPDLDRPRLLPGAEDLVIDLRVAHYEALDMPPFDGIDPFPEPRPPAVKPREED